MSAPPPTPTTLTLSAKPAEALARNLIDRRNQRGWTQAQLARRSGVSRATIANLETGRGDPRVSTLHLLARALELRSASALLEAESELSA